MKRLRISLEAIWSWCYALWTQPSAADKLASESARIQHESLQLMREVVQLQQKQTEVFITLVKSWTQPAPPPLSYTNPIDAEVLSELQTAAAQGDEDARLILGDTKLQRDYLANFR